MAIPFNIVFHGMSAFQGFSSSLTKTNKKTEKLNQKLEQTSKITQLQAKATDGHKKATDRLHGSFQSLIESIPGGGLLTDLADGFGNIKAIIPNLITSISKFGKMLLTSLGPITLITAAFFTLKTIFEANIGGMATQFSKIMGDLKKFWGEFIVSFRNGLKSIGPLINVIMKVLGGVVKFILTTLKGAFKIIGAVLKPIFAVFKEIGTAIKEAFGGGNKKNTDTFKKILKGLGAVLGFVGKILGFVVKTALWPLKIIIIGIVKAVKFFVNIWKKVIGVFKKLFSSKKEAGGFFGFLQKSLQLLLLPIKLIIEGFKKIKGLFNRDKKKNNMGAPGVSANNRPGNAINNNNNQKVTVVTSQPINGEGARQFEERLSKNLATRG